MLIDNKTINDENIKSLFQFIGRNTEDGKLDIVSGYFSISGLAILHKYLTNVEAFRLVLGEITEDKKLGGKAVDLLAEAIDVPSALELNSNAQLAVEFLKMETVDVKTVEPNFCHAKAYIYKDQIKTQNCYYVVGSSNLTSAGMGVKESSNVELNIARFSNDGEYRNIKTWFDNLWKNSARAFTTVDSKLIPFKQYLIDIISNFFKEYTPEELYYKSLFEIFKDNMPELFGEMGFGQEIGHLRNTKIFDTLYPFQQVGVLSLIKMIQQQGGAILADAVGLGKTWQALAVMKYFQLQGYEVVLLCPKKLEHNWKQYLRGHKSKFEADRFDFTVRYHTDLQDDRLEKKDDGLKIASYFQGNPKVLFVIDESHNLRNDKSNRHKFLVQELLQKNDDVRVLLLSATPINNHIADIRNQFKLLVKGHDAGFANIPDLEIGSLQVLFKNAQTEFAKWQQLPEPKTIETLINALPVKLFDLNDKLVLARTRKSIAAQTNNLHFPKKEKPQNEFFEIGQIGRLSSFESILDAMKISMTAYRPTEFTDAQKAKNVLENNMQREMFLVKMMYILLVKRLESSWYSFDRTVENILKHHQNALQKVNAYIEAGGGNQEIDTTEAFSGSDDDELEEAAQLVETQLLEDNDPTNDDDNPLEATLGKKRPIKLSNITHIDTFKEHLEKDVQQFESLTQQLKDFKKTFGFETENTKSSDPKLQRLMQIINEKQHLPNKKIVVFTAFKDTAQYLYDQLDRRGYRNMGLITGSFCRTDANIKYKESNFEPLLEAFAPYTKIWKERDWETAFKGEEMPTSYDEFKERIAPKDANVNQLLQNPIELLIATDCISEGQNLQDCDCVINYDIHWNPVRIIQRFGRIDRLGSPNQRIKGINFWPGVNYDSYLKLKNRVENRMALFALIGAEFDEQMTPELEAKVRNNPLISRQTENLLQQLQTDWADIEDSSEALGFDKLSLEEFRQELYEWFNTKRDELEAIPNGVFTGFVTRPDLFTQNIAKGLVALLRYKGETADNKAEHHLAYIGNNGEIVSNSLRETLTLLRKHKKETRTVPPEIDKSETETLKNMANLIQKWMDNKAGKQHTEQVLDLLSFGFPATPPTKSKEQKLLEDKFKNENFELITWFVLS